MSPHDHCPIARRCPLRNLSTRGAEETCETLHDFLQAIVALHYDAIVEHRSRMDALAAVDLPDLPTPVNRP